MATTSLELITYAATVAPEVDRLVIAGHRAARPFALELRQRLGVTSFGPLIDLRRQLLSSPGMTMQDAHWKQRGVLLDELQASLQGSVSDGLLNRAGPRFTPTDRGREVLDGLTDALSRGLAPLWGSGAELQQASQGVEMVIQRAGNTLGAVDYPAFTVERAGAGVDPSNQPLALWTHLSTLRYLRADAHALAWLPITELWSEKILLTALCYTVGPNSVDVRREESVLIDDDHVTENLVTLEKRGWAWRDANRWEATPAGRQIRRQVEENTNAFNAPPFSVLRDRQRLDLLRVLRELPAAPSRE